MNGTAGTTARIAVVGAGPAGCYTAQALHRALPDARITVIERLPVPYGLIRYGVAADRQGTKGVVRQFARLFERGGVELVGGVTVGTDVSLEALRRACDAVVLAPGMRQDRTPAIDGAGLPGVHGAGRITRLLNAHPEEPVPPPSLGARVAVIGCGNVAMDVVRLLAEPETAFAASDVDDEARQVMADGVRVVHVIARGPAASARFDPLLAREIALLSGVSHVVHGVGDDEEGDDAAGDARLDILAELQDEHGPGDRPDAAVRVEWWFGAVPARIVGDERVRGVEVCVDGARHTIDVDAVVTAIGFEPAAFQRLVDVPDTARADGRVAPGLYVAGWARTGPHGTIARQRADAKLLAARIAGDIAGGAVGGSPDAIAQRAVADAFVAAGATSYEGWLRIDDHERRTARPGRVRRKVRSLDALFALARGAAD